MRKQIMKITATLLALCSFASLTACKGDNGETTTGDDTTAEMTSDIETTAETDESADATTDNSATTDPNATTDGAADATTVPEAPAVAKPVTKEEIVKYYADAVNKVKSSAKGVAKVYTNDKQYNNILELGNVSWLGSIAQTLMNSNLKENNTRIDFTTNADIVANFPPAKSATCNATADIIETADCIDKGTYYEVTLKLNSSMSNPDVNPPVGGGKAGTIFSIIAESDITDATKGIVTFEGIKNSYFDCTATALIEKETGNMTELYTIVPTTMSFDKVTVFISASNISVGLQYETKWEISW